MTTQSMGPAPPALPARSISASQEEPPAADEQVPAQPEPQSEQDPPADRIAHDVPDDLARRRPPIAVGHQTEPLIREDHSEHDRPPDQPDRHPPTSRRSFGVQSAPRPQQRNRLSRGMRTA